MVVSELVFTDDEDVGVSGDGYVPTTMSLPLNWSVGTAAVASVLLKTHMALPAGMFAGLFHVIASVRSERVELPRFPPRSVRQQLSTPRPSLSLFHSIILLLIHRLVPLSILHPLDHNPLDQPSFRNTPHYCSLLLSIAAFSTTDSITFDFFKEPGRSSSCPCTSLLSCT